MFLRSGQNIVVRTNPPNPYWRDNVSDTLTWRYVNGEVKLNKYAPKVLDLSTKAASTILGLARKLNFLVSSLNAAIEGRDRFFRLDIRPGGRVRR